MVVPEEKQKEEDAKNQLPSKKVTEEQKEEELSEEDKQLKEKLELCVSRLTEKQFQLAALEQISSRIRSATSSMTSVPKPLKFLRSHYKSMVSLYNSAPNKQFADVLSVLGMTFNEALKFRLEGTEEWNWGHEYVRHLSAEIIQDCQADSPVYKGRADVINLCLKLIDFFMKHNAEPDAVDLALEVEILEKVVDYLDLNTFQRVCNYITSCASYLGSPDDSNALKIVHTIYRKFDKLPQALIVSLKLNDHAMIKDDFDSCADPLLKKQLAFMLSRQLIYIEVADEKLQEIIANVGFSERFLQYARELDVLDPKVPEDVYKSHLENTRSSILGANVDSAKQNLASSIVNGFLNAGFGSDKLVTAEESWVYKNKDHGMLSASASIGLIMLWDVELGLNMADKFLYSTEENIKAGALLAIGIVNCGVKNESDPAIALLSEYLEDKNVLFRMSAISGMGLAYVGSGREDLVESLSSIVSDTGLSVELAGNAALSLGLIFVGSGNGDVTSTILQTMMERDEKVLKEPWAKYFALALGLIYLGKAEEASTTLETLKAIEHPLSKQTSILVTSCAYAGSGNVLKIQELLRECNDHLDKEKEDDTFQGFAAIGLALVSMGEEIGSQMVLRILSQLMHYGEPTIRKAVPLALGLLCASNPLVNVLDTLSKYSHDNDQDVANNAIFAMGLVGAGTNNARLAQMLRQLASYYHKEPNSLFLVRIAQGLLHMGKGTLSVNPFHSDRYLLSPVAVAGLLSVIIAFSDSKKFILDKYHWIIYYLVPAMYPRFLITLDEELNNLSATVRVGQAVDTVGQAGRPKTITGFQTHSTPVLLAYTERAELGTDEFLTMSPVLEGFVILKKNPNFIDETNEGK